MTKASETQVGGDHYRLFKIQPVDFIGANRLPYAEGCVIKYVCRHRAKGGRQDIEKAIHYLQLILEAEYPVEPDLSCYVCRATLRYAGEEHECPGFQPEPPEERQVCRWIKCVTPGWAECPHALEGVESTTTSPVPETCPVCGKPVRIEG